MVLVLGRQSNVRGTPFYNGQLVLEILEKCAGFNKIKTFERNFINKFGDNIKEDIIIVTKSGQLTNEFRSWNRSKSLRAKFTDCSK